MLLAIDIGNTNVTIGVFDGENLLASWRLSTDPRRLADEYALQLRGLLPLHDISTSDVTGIAICSVVPPLTPIFQQASQSIFESQVLIIGPGTKTGVRISYDNPHDVGSDRIVDAVAASQFYGCPSIIVDFGTATVFDAISGDGSYLGGAIAPGLNIAAESLFLNASQLKRVELLTPATAIGKNTTHSMQSGLMLGYVGLVESMVNRFKQELGDPAAKVIATGGLAPLIAKETTSIDFIDPDLTLRGLQYLYSLNSSSTSTDP